MRAANPAPRDPDEGIADLPCSVCGQPSVGWSYFATTDEEGHDVIEAHSACDAHRLELIKRSDSQAS